MEDPQEPNLSAQPDPGKYCANSPFLETQASAKASHGWKGILVGRDLLVKGLGWVIGSGTGVKLWGEPWLSTAEPMAPDGAPTRENKDWCVSNLILEGTNEWNFGAIPCAPSI